jgi:CHAD domain-containing protein
MGMSEHTNEQGLRVHHLMNLGGLIAVAGLDREPPDFLLGVLVSAAHEAAALTAEERARVASLGHEKLDERATAKRAWRSWRRTRELHSLLLSTAQMRRLIEVMGGAAPENAEGLVAVLMELLGGVGNAAADAAR